MKKPLGAVVIFVFLLFGFSCQPALSNNTSGNQTSAPQGITIHTTQTEMVGKMAPNFRLSDMKGQEVSLSDFAGKPILLVFWATWSLDSRSEMPVIQQVLDKWSDEGLVVLTIDILHSRPDETQAAVEDFVNKNAFSFPVLLDENQLATIQYHVGETPTNFLISREGIIREITPGPFLSLSAVETSLTRIMPQ